MVQKRYKRGNRHYVVTIDVDFTGGRWFASVLTPLGVRGAGHSDRDEAISTAKVNALDVLTDMLRRREVIFDTVIFSICGGG